VKTVTMTREFIYHAKHNVVIHYLGGATYDRVPEAAVRSILNANAGYVVSQDRSWNGMFERFQKELK